MKRIDLFVAFLEGERDSLGDLIERIKTGMEPIDDDDREILGLFYKKYRDMEDLADV